VGGLDIPARLLSRELLKRFLFFRCATSEILTTIDQDSDLWRARLLYERTDSVQTSNSCTFGVKIAESDSVR
jgi:hypothetical protein